MIPFFCDLDKDADNEIAIFARRTVKDLKLPPAFVTQITQSIQVWDLLCLPLMIYNCESVTFLLSSLTLVTCFLIRSSCLGL